MKRDPKILSYVIITIISLTETEYAGVSSITETPGIPTLPVLRNNKAEHYLFTLYEYIIQIYK